MLEKFLKKNKAAGEPPRRAKNGSANPQGITARGNGLRKVAATGFLVALGAACAGFAYLLLLREPGLQTQQIERVAASFATQQATNIQRLVGQMRKRMASAAGTPLAMSAIANRSREDIARVEQGMIDFFPEVASLHILPVGDMGTAELEGGAAGLRNHIEVDLVRRTAEGDKTQPEAYRFEERWMTSIAQLVTHPDIEDTHLPSWRSG